MDHTLNVLFSIYTPLLIEATYFLRTMHLNGTTAVSFVQFWKAFVQHMQTCTLSET